MSKMITAMDIREKVRMDLLDYQQLVSLLAGYSKPRDRITALLAESSLIRVRKGLYAFGDRYRHGPLSRELLSNLIYGPSYVSLDYALSAFGMIPERVEIVTAMTTGEPRRFDTPFGVFTYRPLSLLRYSTGVNWSGESDIHYLMASPEKALVDKVWSDKRFNPAKEDEFDAYLFEDLRIEEEHLTALNQDRLGLITRSYASRKINLLAKYLAARTGVRS